jgi:hypothetical protein
VETRRYDALPSERFRRSSPKFRFTINATVSLPINTISNECLSSMVTDDDPEICLACSEKLSFDHRSLVVACKNKITSARNLEDDLLAAFL